MSGPQTGLLRRSIRALYAMLVRVLLPASFRSDFGPELRDTFERRLSETGGAWATLRLALSELLDLVRTSIREWGVVPGRAGRRGGSRPPDGRPSGATADRSRITTGVVRETWTALRSLARRPGLAIGVTLTIGLGVGATTTIYAVVDGVMFRPLPYDDPGRLVTVGSIPDGPAAVDAETGLYDLGPVGLTEYQELRDRARSFDLLAAIQPIPVLVSTENGTETYVPGARVTPSFFTVLGTTPALGRSLLPEDAVFADPRDEAAQIVVLITHGYWQRRYGGDPDIIGRSLEGPGAGSQLAGSTIVGVLPESYAPPEPFHAAGELPEIYAPIPEIPSVATTPEGGVRVFALGLRLLARLSAGTTVEQAGTEVANLGEELLEASGTQPGPGRVGRGGLGLNRLHAETVGSTGGTLWIFLGAAGLLLVLTVLNAASLLLARGLDRMQELGVRMALGAGRARIARLLLVETGVLLSGGAMLGVVLAYAGVDGFLRFAPDSIPRLAEVGVDARVLSAAAAVALFTGLASGFVPILQLSDRSLGERIQRRGRSVAESSSRMRSALVAGQLGLALVLLSGAGLLFSSFVRLSAADPGFDPDGLVAVEPASSGQVRIQIGGDEDLWRLWEPALGALGAAPGVEAVGGVSDPPFRAPRWSPRILLPEDDPETVREGIAGYVISPGYLETLGTEVVRGRGLGVEDGPDAERVALVNESFIQSQFDGRDPVGSIIRRETEGLVGAGELVPMRVVGVVEDVVQTRLEEGGRPAVYIPHTQADLPQLASRWVLIRSDLPMQSVADPARAALGGIGENVRTLEPVTAWMATARTTPRFRTMLIASFAVVGVLLAALGLYGSLAQMVRRRERELGVRMALGADRRSVLGMVLARGMRISLTGTALGVIATLVFARVLRTFLFEMEPYDPLTLISVVAVLTAISVVACLAPAGRATSVDPIRVLKSE